MSKITENDLKKHIKERSFSPVYILHGDEPYLIYHYVNKIQKSAVLEFEDFNTYKGDGDDLRIDEVVNTCITMPMMNDYRIIMLRDVKFNESDADIDRLLEYVESPNPTTILVFFYIGQTPAKTGKWKKLFSATEKNGSVIEIKKKSSDEIAKLLCTKAGKLGCTMSLKAAEHLIFCCGDDLFTLFGELDKLCSYKLNNEVRLDDIDLICSKTVNAKAYFIAKEINRKNITRALKYLDELYELEKDANYLIYPLSSPYIDMFNYLIARNSRLNPVQFAGEIGYKRPEAINYSQNEANSLGLEKVTKCLEILFECDAKLKSLSGVDEKVLLEQTVVSLCEVVKE